MPQYVLNIKGKNFENYIKLANVNEILDHNTRLKLQILMKL